MNIKKAIHSHFHFSLKDTITTFLILSSTIAVCLIMRLFFHDAINVPMIFILSIFLVSRFTNGYFYGMLSSFICVLAVNFIFTYPFFQFNFTLSGYPITIICMLAVAIITSALTTRTKNHADMQLAAEKEKTRSNLLRAVSHDLRTPLTSILGATSAIIENDDLLLKEERLKLLSEIKDDSQWLIQMVENLLSITRIGNDDSAKITKHLEAVEELIPGAVNKFKKRFPNQIVNVKVPHEFLMVPMDALLIEQVIINLLENAVLHSKIVSEISLTVVFDKTSAIFEVSDNGQGIEKDILPHIFEGLYRTPDESSSDSKKNMGIGLSVCNTIIKAHNGTMNAYNKPRGGAVFNFSLPLEEKTNEF
ncbi:MAG: DUF4118 domain-containing protein [Clostridia bacterium]